MSEEKKEEKPVKPVWFKKDLPMKRLQQGECDAKLREIDFKIVHQELTLDYMKKHPEDSIKSAEFNIASMKHQRESLVKQKKVIDKQVDKILREGK